MNGALEIVDSLVTVDEADRPEITEKEIRELILARLAQQLIPLRKNAVEARINSGIEAVWEYCELAMNGEDEVTQKLKAIYKPIAEGAPFIFSQDEEDEWTRSSIFINITAPYVLTASGRAHEILFPNDMRNWELDVTPKQDIEELTSYLRELPEGTAEQLISIIESSKLENFMDIKEAERSIDDWLNEGDMDCLRPFSDKAGEFLENAALMGTGAFEGPVPVPSEKNPGEFQPTVEVFDVKELYPAENCGENIHKGDYIFRLQTAPAREVRKYIEQGEKAGWLPDQLQLCLKDGPASFVSGSKTSSNNYEFWKFQGEVDIDMLRGCGCRLFPDDSGPKIWANITICNDRIVRVSRSYLQNRFTYRVMPWRRRKGYWAGIGVAEDLEDPQRSLNAQVRNLQDNSALSAVPQIVFWKGLLVPSNGRHELAPGKFWIANAGDEFDNEKLLQFVKNGIFTIEIPCQLSELRENINLFLGLAEQVTGIAAVVRGIETPDSVGGGQLQINSAAQNSRRITRNWDNFVLRPLIQDFVRWYKEILGRPLAESFVRVYGSSVLVERDIQAQAVQAAVQLAANPIFGHDPVLMMNQWLESNRFDPRKTKLTPERQEELAELMRPGPDEKAQAAIQSAMIRAQALTNQAGMEAQTDGTKIAANLENEARKRDHEARMKVMDYRMKIAEYATMKGIDLQMAQQQMEAIDLPSQVVLKQVEGDIKERIEKAKPKPTASGSPTRPKR